MFFVYILHSASLDRFYIGMTANVEQRLSKHLSNHKGYTSRAKDWKVVFVEDFVSKEQAFDKERQIKKWKSRKAILKLIKDSEHPD